jgi:hypothetical protein
LLRGLVDFAEECSKRPTAADGVAGIRVVVREHIAVRFPDPVKRGLGPILLRVPPPVLNMHHLRIHPVKNTTSLRDLASGRFDPNPVSVPYPQTRCRVRVQLGDGIRVHLSHGENLSMLGVIKGEMPASGDEDEGVLLEHIRTTVRRLRGFSVLRKRVVTQSLQGF